MMQNLSIRKKIILISLLPFLAFLAFGIMRIQKSRTDFLDSVTTKEVLSALSVSSDLIHSLQLERAKSIGFSSGMIDRPALESQQKTTDEKVQLAADLIGSTVIGKNNLFNMGLFSKKLIDIRNEIFKGSIERESIIGFYTNGIADILKVESFLSERAKIVGVPVALRSVLILETAKESAGRLRANILDILAKNDALNSEQFKLIGQLQAGVSMNLTSLGLVISAEGKERIAKFLKSPEWIAASEVADVVIRKNATGQFSQDSVLFMQNITSAINNLAPIVKAEVQSISSHVDEVNEAADKSFWTLLWVTIISFLVVAVLTWKLTRDVVYELNSVNGEIVSSADRVRNASMLLSGASQKLSSGATENAASLEETVASMDMIKKVVASNAESAIEASQLSMTSARSADLGEVEIANLSSAMKDISESSNRIKEIIAVIDDIAFQTNLLALNAAVEAARAGEHGKGFAVVADAVRSLAQRSASAAQDVSTLIIESVGNTERGLVIAQRNSEVLNGIVESVRKVADLNSRISNTSQEQTTSIGQVGNALEQMEAVSHQNASAAEEAASSSEKLFKEAEVLGSVVCRLSRVVNGGGSV